MPVQKALVQQPRDVLVVGASMGPAMSVQQDALFQAVVVLVL